jgi:hypothetical protein
MDAVVGRSADEGLGYGKKQSLARTMKKSFQK